MEPGRPGEEGVMADRAGVRDGLRGIGDRSSAVSVATLVAVSGGLVLVVVGTFLPWLRTGLASRNSFRAAGLIRRLLHPPGVAGFLLSGWPGIVLLCAVAVALIAVGLRRTGSVLAAAVATTAGAVALTTLLLPGRSYATVAPTGPSVTAAGAGLVLAGIAVRVVRAATAARRARVG